MAAPVTRLYNHTARRLATLNLTTLRVMLLNASAVFNATHTTLTQVAGAGNVNQVSGNGWTAGGLFLGSVVWTTITTDDAKLSAADPVVTATGGAIGPAYAAVVYDDSDASDAPVAFLDFGGAISAGEGTEFKIVLNTDGLIKLSYTQPA